MPNKETTPLIDGRRRRTFSNLMPSRPDDFTRRTTIMSQDSERQSFENDFDRTDSMGILHNEDSVPNTFRNDPFIDHTRGNNNMNIFEKRGSPRSYSQRISPSQLENWVNRKRAQSFGSSGRNTGKDVVLDIEAMRRNATKSSGSETFENSNPSSRRSSAGASSLDDVCLPLDEIELAVWPDVSVLEEFSKEETERLRAQAVKDTEEFNFQWDADDRSSDGQGGICFSHPIVTNVDVPELGNTRINETELKTGRLRSQGFKPWQKKQYQIQKQLLKKQYEQKDKEPLNIEYPPHIVNNNPEHFRFTYFREDLDSTIHSPTISGLLQPGQHYDELFVAQSYSNKSKVMSPAPGATPVATPTLGSTPALELDQVSPFWLDVLNPTEEEMKVISKAFGIHPLTTEDIFLGETREKVELFKDYYLVCFRSFDIVHERKRKSRLTEGLADIHETQEPDSGFGISNIINLLRRRRQSSVKSEAKSLSSSYKRRQQQFEEEMFKRKSGDRKKRDGELEPLNVYIIVFRTGVLTFHFAPTPHPINVRRRARLLQDYLTVSADWIAYALIDDITDAFAPMIELIEDEVYDIEDAILKMHQSEDSSDDESSSDEEDAFSSFSVKKYKSNYAARHDGDSTISGVATSKSSTASSSSRSTSSNILRWRKKGDMLRRIGDCRKRVMSIVRLLGYKADVIKGFSKRCNENWEVAPRSEIGMYLGDIQDHIITMVQSLNHYEKLLSRSHSNYLAQINIDMTKVNNDMNDVLGKITILGTVVLPLNVITGAWGMNVLVPGQKDDNSLNWFAAITSFMAVFAGFAFFYTKRKFDL